MLGEIFERPSAMNDMYPPVVKFMHAVPAGIRKACRVKSAYPKLGKSRADSCAGYAEGT